MVAKRIPTPDHPLIDSNKNMDRIWYDFFLQTGKPALLVDAPNDSQAAKEGVPVFGLYRTGSTVKVRMT